MLKATAADYLHFVLLTGVSKYGKISLFSDLNNLLDITMDRRFATLLGYTQAELEQYFPERIDQVAQTYNMSRAEMLALIAHWYNGYSWDGVNKVYVPFSTLVFLEQQMFANHWFSTATPSFLLKLLRQQQIPAYELERVGGGSTLVGSADVNNINVHSFAQIALDPIRIKQYDLPYRNQGKPIILLGIAFDQSNRNIAEWQMEQLP